MRRFGTWRGCWARRRTAPPGPKEVDLMTCAEFRKHLPERALGDLDVERSSAMSAHRGGCADCRAAEATLEKAVSLLKSVVPVAPSTGRRSAAVAAMARAQAERSESLARRPRRTWAPW